MSNISTLSKRVIPVFTLMQFNLKTGRHDVRKYKIQQKTQCILAFLVIYFCLIRKVWKKHSMCESILQCDSSNNADQSFECQWLQWKSAYQTGFLKTYEYVPYSISGNYTNMHQLAIYIIFMHQSYKEEVRSKIPLLPRSIANNVITGKGEKKKTAEKMISKKYTWTKNHINILSDKKLHYLYRCL